MDIRHAVGVKAGIPEEKLADLDRWEDSARFTARERAALAFCERIVRDDVDAAAADDAALREHFSEAEIVELTFVIGYQTFASTFANAFRLAPQGFSEPRRPQPAFDQSYR